MKIGVGESLAESIGWKTLPVILIGAGAGWLILKGIKVWQEWTIKHPYQFVLLQYFLGFLVSFCGAFAMVLYWVSIDGNILISKLPKETFEIIATVLLITECYLIFKFRSHAIFDKLKLTIKEVRSAISKGRSHR